MKINIEEVEFSGITTDPYGRVFSWKDKLLRGIYPEQVENVKRVISCGLINELVQQNLFPETSITDFELQGFGVVIEHKKIPVITYPYGWCFSMLKDAALTILKVNIIARKYGYETIDAHPYNILFEYSQPKFVDLGSFRKVSSGSLSWAAYEEFVKSYWYPLNFWKSGNFYLAQRIITDRIRKMPHSTYYFYYYPLFRTFPVNFIDKIIGQYYKFKHVSVYSDQEIRQKLSNKRLAQLIIWLKRKNILPLQRVKFEKLFKEIEALRSKKFNTQWGDYHDQYQKGDQSAILSSSRFNRILEIIKQHKVDSAVELAGNQGAFSRLLLTETRIKNVICTDYDPNAIETMYTIIKELRLNITPALLDFVFPVSTSFTKIPSNRFKSDLVIALAVTHHLILTQDISIQDIFRIMAEYTNQYIAVEFMPLGLYNPKTNPEPLIPDWYKIDWFRNNFLDFFDLLHEEEVAVNRVLFFGVLKKKS